MTAAFHVYVEDGPAAIPEVIVAMQEEGMDPWELVVAAMPLLGVLVHDLCSHHESGLVEEMDAQFELFEHNMRAFDLHLRVQGFTDLSFEEPA